MDTTEATITKSTKPVVNYSFLVTLALSAVTILNNALILLAFARQRRLWTYTNYYILNMTLADILVGTLIMPLRSTIILYDGWVFGREAGVALLMMQNSSLGVSVLGVVVITVDRYLATFYPMKHYTKRSKALATVINILTWLIPFVFWMFLNVVWDVLAPSGLTTAVGLPRPNFTRTLSLAVMTFTIRFVCPLVLIMFFYLRIYHQIRSTASGRLSKSLAQKRSTLDKMSDLKSCPTPANIKLQDAMALNSSQGSGVERSGVLNDSREVSTISQKVSKEHRRDMDMVSSQSQAQTSKIGGKGGSVHLDDLEATVSTRTTNAAKRESSAEGRKAMRTLSFIVVAFALTWLPNSMSFTIYSISPATYKIINDAMDYTEVARWITYSNSLFNPMAYAMAQPLIRETIAAFFCRRCR
ncbi:muscarinic acetylcholine receptor M1-like [Diadema setosum]|uniref:muscarinic acetylcholine receptor M1-like n=1 Tax=Diadema setosum TaxID=31175 RepID=UPI003B3A089F